MRKYFMDTYKNTTFLSDTMFGDKGDVKLTYDSEDEVLVYNELGLKGSDTQKKVNVICDVALMNLTKGYSIGIEIKSDKDTVKRLDNQLSVYEKYFDYIYILVTSKNIEGVLQKSDKKVGILLYEGKGVYKLVRVAEKIEFKKSGKYWGKLLWLEEIHEEFNRLKVDYRKNPLLRYKNQKVNMFNSLYIEKGEYENSFYKTRQRVMELLYQRALDELKGVKKTKHDWGRNIEKEDSFIEIKSGK